MLTEILFLIQFAMTFYLTGLIWTIQLVHYPSFSWVEPGRFVAFENFHTRAMCFIVVVPMIVELATAAGLVWIAPPIDIWFWEAFAYGNLFLVVLLWLSTALLSVPLHQKLGEARDEDVMRRLVRTNWPRTILWTVKCLLLSAALLHLLSR